MKRKYLHIFLGIVLSVQKLSEDTYQESLRWKEIHN